MIGLTFMVVIGLWLFVAVTLSKKIPLWLGITKHRVALSVLLFPVLLAAPVADDLIGRSQFYRLCEREAVVTLSPDAGKVKRARHRNIPTIELEGYVIPIRSQREEYVDIDSGRTFITVQAFHTGGGFIFRHGANLGNSTSCWPKDFDTAYKSINLHTLIEKGK